MEIRDPIHGFIKLDSHEEELLNSIPMQRLRGIRQLALACLVYPGASHTRFEHSLGVMHVADRMARAIDLPHQRRAHVRLACLLHDIGHGPFSHVAEQLLLLETIGGRQADARFDIESPHEAITLDTIRHDRTIIRALGRGASSVIALIGRTRPRTASKDIVSGPMDADKLDYLLRDSYFAGVKYGVVDIERIVNTLDEVPAGGGESHLVISEDGAFAVAQLLIAKHFMTVQVYQHRARAITDAMLVRSVELAVEEKVPGLREVFSYDGSRRSLERYLACDDHRLFQMILNGRRARRSKEYCERLLSRRLFKEVFRKNIADIPNALVVDRILKLSQSRRDVLDLQGRIARAMRKDSAMVILDIQDISNPTYRSPGFEVHEADIMVKRRDGSIVKIQDLPDVIIGQKERKQTYINVYCEMDGMNRVERRRYARRVDQRILEVLEGLGG